MKRIQYGQNTFNQTTLDAYKGFIHEAFCSFNVKLFNSQINKLKSGIKSCTKLNLSSNVVGDLKREINLSNKLLMTHTFRGFDISRLHKAFVNG